MELSQNEFNEVCADVCKKLKIKSIYETFSAQFYVARELRNREYDFIFIKKKLKTDCSISELKDGIKRLPKKEEVKKEKPKENYVLSASIYIEGMDLTESEKKRYLPFLVECLKWGKE